MFDKLIDLILQFVDRLIPFVVMDHYERGVVLRCGIYNERKLEPGYHWIIPLLDRVLSDNVKPRLVKLGVQSLTTKDNKNVTVRSVVTAEIRDIYKALLEVESVDEALQDSCLGSIGALIASHTWDEIRHESFSETLTKACRKQAWRYGIEINAVQLSDLTLAQTVRLLR